MCGLGSQRCALFAPQAFSGLRVRDAQPALSYLWDDNSGLLGWDVTSRGGTNVSYQNGSTADGVSGLMPFPYALRGASRASPIVARSPSFCAPVSISFKLHGAPKPVVDPTLIHATLGAKNGVPARSYSFKRLDVPPKPTGGFSQLMIAACKRLGMKPVCDHPSYCRNDKTASLYLGQSNHISYPPHRNSNNFNPVGWAKLRSHWDGACVYTAGARGNYALCNAPTNTHAWYTPQPSARLAQQLYNDDNASFGM